MENINTFYPEMNQVAPEKTELVAQYLYKKYKITCLNGISLKENRNVNLEYIVQGNKVYYVSESGFNKLKQKYNIAISLVLD